MPLYDFECGNCGTEFEVCLAVSDCDKSQYCPECDRISRKVIRSGHGGIFRKSDASPWVRDAAKVLTDSDRPNPNLQSVDDLKRYLAENPKVRPKESHPAFPSSYGDCFDNRPDPAARAQERSRKGLKKLREMRAISI